MGLLIENKHQIQFQFNAENRNNLAASNFKVF